MKQLIVLIFLCCGAVVKSQPVSNDMAFASASFDGFFSDNGNRDVAVSEMNRLIESRKARRAVLGYSKNNYPVEAYYFPGTSNQKALIIGGMHGSELSSVEVANKIIQLLKKGEVPFYNVVIIPKLFPDNAEKALSPEKGPVNKGRYTNETCADPNRQMPVLGTSFDAAHPFDSYGRVIEKENQLLLQLIQDYAPSRIVNLHAIKDVARAGIYADPRTDCNGYALGFAADSSLAVAMAKTVLKYGGRVPGNNMEHRPTALYYNDPCAAAQGLLQKRNLHGSALPDNRGAGVSLGSWATTAVCNGNNKRDAMQLITMEFPGYKGSANYTAALEKQNCLTTVKAFAASVVNVFLNE